MPLNGPSSPSSKPWMGASEIGLVFPVIGLDGDSKVADGSPASDPHQPSLHPHWTGRLIRSGELQTAIQSHRHTLSFEPPLPEKNCSKHWGNITSDWPSKPVPHEPTIVPNQQTVLLPIGWLCDAGQQHPLANPIHGRASGGRSRL